MALDLQYFVLFQAFTEDCAFEDTSVITAGIIKPGITQTEMNLSFLSWKTEMIIIFISWGLFVDLNLNEVPKHAGVYKIALRVPGTSSRSPPCLSPVQHAAHGGYSGNVE